jgi:hypothetical protein
MKANTIKYCLENKIPYRIRFKESVNGFHTKAMTFNLNTGNYKCDLDEQEVSGEFYHYYKQLFESI